MTLIPIYRDDAFIHSCQKQRSLVWLASDKQWVDCIAALVSHSQSLGSCFVKLIWEDEPVTRTLLLDPDAMYEVDYYAEALEAMITGVPRGWYRYKEIEWIDFCLRIVAMTMPIF